MSAAVLIRGASKNYGSGKNTKVILDGLNMTVERGTIYGLLGASGCGKTTLLSCVVGRRELNAGEIWVLGGQPGTPGSGVPGPRIGYMPQDIALVAEFSVKDAVFYFGQMYGLSEDQLSRRLAELSKLLELPPSDRYIKNCSGGQQRRVSFAAAMVHEPELLILDEPTVGLDPVLRERIWDHLVELTTKKGVTVIITTHYIEETRQAHQIGLMRGGKLIAEEAPDQLLRLFNSDHLEDVFLMLSIRQTRGEPVPEFETEEYLAMKKLRNDHFMNEFKTNNNKPPDQTHVGSNLSLVMRENAKVDVKKTQSKFLSLHRLGALLTKNIIAIKRNKSGVLFTLVLPIVQVVLFFLAIGGDPKDLRLAVVNDEINWRECANFTSHYKSVSYFPENETCELTLISCRFLEGIREKTANKIFYDNLNEAKDAVRAGKVHGVMYFSENFTAAVSARRNDGRDAFEWDVDSSEIQIWMDMSDRQIAYGLQKNLYEDFFDYTKNLLIECHNYPKLGEIPIHFYDPVYGAFDEEARIFMVPGVLVTIIYFICTSSTASVLITDRIEGVWDRSLVAGVSTAEIMLTHFLTQSLVMGLQAVELLVITFCIFRVVCHGNFIVSVAIILLQGFAGILNGFLISIQCNTYNTANIITTGLFYFMILICGVVWPLEGMSTGLHYFSLCTPFTYAIISLRNVIERGWPLSNPHVYNGVLVTSAWISAYILLSFILLRRKM